MGCRARYPMRCITPFRLCHISSFIFFTAGVTSLKRRMSAGARVKRIGFPFSDSNQLSNAVFLPGKNLVNARCPEFAT